MTISSRFPVLVLLLGMIPAVGPPPSAGSTLIGQQAADTRHEVVGIVRSAESGMPLAGAMVVVLGTDGSAVTHGDGSLRIAVPDAERHRIRIDRLGYAVATVEVERGEPAAVDLEVAAIPLPEVVVTAVLSPTAANETIRPSAVFTQEKLQRRLAAGTSWVDDWGHAGGAFRYYSNDYGIPGGFLGGHTNPVRTEQERAAGRFRSVIRPGRGFEAIELDAGHTSPRSRGALRPATRRWTGSWRPRRGWLGARKRTGRFEEPTDGFAILGLSGGRRLTFAGRLHVVTQPLHIHVHEHWAGWARPRDSALRLGGPETVRVSR